MTRDDLINKRKELAVEVDDLRKKVTAIDEVLSLFPEQSPPLPGIAAEAGPYAGMTVASAIFDFLSKRRGMFIPTAMIAAALREGGIASESDNFTTIVSSTCARLVDRGEIATRERDGRKSFAIPQQEDRGA